MHERHGLKVFDIDKGIGTHVLIEEGLAYPGSTAVSTDSHANILGAVGAFGQGMGDKDIAATWHKGSTWFKVPQTVKIVLEGQPGPTTFSQGYGIESTGSVWCQYFAWKCH